MATKKKEEVEKTSKKDSTEEVLLVDPEAKANFWKPKKEGETRTGKFLAKSTTEYGDVLNLETPDGPCIIPISACLKKVDWDAVVGRNLFFQYVGTQKRYRKFLVKALAE